MKTKICTKCKKEKELSDFYVKKANPDNLCTACKDCSKAYSASYRASHIEECRVRKKKHYRMHMDETKVYNKDYYQKNYFLRHYGISKKQVDEMITIQGNKCAICGEDMKRSKNRHVDHDHENKRVRMILCSCCNQGLGLFRDSSRLLSIAAAYLRGFDDAF